MNEWTNERTNDEWRHVICIFICLSIYPDHGASCSTQAVSMPTPQLLRSNSSRVSFTYAAYAVSLSHQRRTWLRWLSQVSKKCWSLGAAWSWIGRILQHLATYVTFWICWNCIPWPIRQYSCSGATALYLSCRGRVLIILHAHQQCSQASPAGPPRRVAADSALPASALLPVTTHSAESTEPRSRGILLSWKCPNVSFAHTWRGFLPAPGMQRQSLSLLQASWAICLTQTYLGHTTNYYLGLPRSSHLHMLQTNGTAPSRSRHRTFSGSACFSQPPRVSTRTPEAPDLPRRPAKQNLHFVAPLAGWISIAGKSEPPQPAEKATTNTSNSPHIRVRRLLFVYVLWMWGVPHLQNTQLSYDGYAPAVTSCKINRFSMATAPAVTNRHSGFKEPRCAKEVAREVRTWTLALRHPTGKATIHGTSGHKKWWEICFEMFVYCNYTTKIGKDRGAVPVFQWWLKHV